MAGHEHHHDHEHEHEHHHHSPVRISHHEGALIGALEGTMPVADYDAAEALLAAQLREAGRRINEAGGIIGHIKFILTAAGRCGQISVTDTEESIRHFDGAGCRIEGVAIVLALEEETLEEILEETVGSLIDPGN